MSNIDYDNLDQRSAVAAKPNKASSMVLLAAAALLGGGALYYVNFVAGKSPDNREISATDEAFKIDKTTVDNFELPGQKVQASGPETIKIEAPANTEVKQAADVNATVVEGEDLAAKAFAAEQERLRLAAIAEEESKKLDAERAFELQKLKVAADADIQRAKEERLAAEIAAKAAADAEAARLAEEERLKREAIEKAEAETKAEAERQRLAAIEADKARLLAEREAKKAAAAAELEARLASDLIVFDGNKKEEEAQSAVPPLPPTDDKGQIIRVPGQTRDGNLALLAQSEQAQPEAAKATRIERPDATLAQGTLIRGFLETALNSDLPGMVRAVIREDVYSMDGRRILIPKGSRMIGDYSADVVAGQSRVYVIWQRVLRADGISMSIVSPGTDNLGRSGMRGHVDTKFWQRFGSALILSVINIGIDYVGNVQTKQTTRINPVTGAEEVVEERNANSGNNLTDLATEQGGKTISDFASQELGRNANIKPTITIDQGVPVIAFLRRDIDFSAYYADTLQAELRRLIDGQAYSK
jgi:type IV secretion system protein VirB10